MTTLSPKAQRLIDLARTGDEPEPADQERVRRALSATLAGSAALGAAGTAKAMGAAVQASAPAVTTSVAAPAAAGTTATVITSTLGGKVAMGIVAASMAVSATLWLPNSPNRESVSDASHVDDTSMPVVTKPVAKQDATPSAQPPSAQPTPTIVATVAATAIETQPVPAPNPAPSPTSSPLATQRATHLRPIARNGQTPPWPDRAVAGAARSETVRDQQTPRAADTHPPVSQVESEQTTAGDALQPTADTVKHAAPDVLRAESDLLERALLASRASQHERALAILTEHARAFPKGWLAEDRLAQSALELCALGRMDDATIAEQSLLRAFPRSHYAARVSACIRP